MAKKRKPELKSYIVRGTIELRGYYIVEADSPEDARERVDAGDGEFDDSNYERVNWEATSDGELNE